MMNKYILYGIMGFFFLIGCDNQEGNLEPSRKDRYWLEIQDEPGELNQLRYRLYKTYGISLFVNDTLGKEDRGVDAYGQPIIHYEVLRPGYNLTGEVKFVYKLSDDTMAMIKMTRLVLDFVAPKLPRNVKCRPYSYLLCEDIHIKSFDSYVDDTLKTTYILNRTLKTTSMNVDGILTMDENALKDLEANILGSAIYVNFEEHFEEDLKVFYNVTNEGSTSTVYGKFLMTYAGVSVLPDREYEKRLHALSFIRAGTMEYYYAPNIDIMNPSTLQDVEAYVGAVYAYTETEFEALYGQYDKMMRKFRLMKTLVGRFKSEVLKEE